MESDVPNRQTATERSDGAPLSERLSDISAQRRQVKQKSRSGEFLKGPVPMVWLRRAMSLPSRAALLVGLALWFRVGCDKRKTALMVGARLRKSFGLNRQAYYRGVDDLEAAGLVTVNRIPGGLAKITIRDVDIEE